MADKWILLAPKLTGLFMNNEEKVTGEGFFLQIDCSHRCSNPDIFFWQSNTLTTSIFCPSLGFIHLWLKFFGVFLSGSNAVQSNQKGVVPNGVFFSFSALHQLTMAQRYSLLFPLCCRLQCRRANSYHGNGLFIYLFIYTWEKIWCDLMFFAMVPRRASMSVSLYVCVCVCVSLKKVSRLFQPCSCLCWDESPRGAM